MKKIFYSLFIILCFVLVTKELHSEQHIYDEAQRQITCLAKNIYYESATESDEGKKAVAQITVNRVNSGKFSDTICGVVEQRKTTNGNLSCQFSWFCKNQKPIEFNSNEWKTSLTIAKKLLTSSVFHTKLYKENALYYHADYVRPGWKHSKSYVTTIGRHIFYREKV